MDSIALIATEGSGEVEKLAKMRNKPPPDLYARRISLQTRLSSAKTTKPPGTHHRREKKIQTKY
jgi:hypothetical protein